MFDFAGSIHEPEHKAFDFSMVAKKVWSVLIAQISFKVSTILSLKLAHFIAHWLKSFCFLLAHSEEFLQICVVAAIRKEFS